LAKKRRIDEFLVRVPEGADAVTRMLHFVMTSAFGAAWSSFGFGDDELRALEAAIAVEPDAPVMAGTGGFRKLRFSRPGSGKSGGVRVCFLRFPEFETVFLVEAFAKNVKQNLAKSERNALRRLAEALRAQLRKQTEGDQ